MRRPTFVYLCAYLATVLGLNLFLGLVVLAQDECSSGGQCPGGEEEANQERPDDKQQQQQGENHATTGSARARFRMPKLFEFSKYKQIFHKTYSSILEELTRQKYFLARVFRVLISTFKYDRAQTSYYLALSELSDQSPSELNAMTNRELLRASLDSSPSSLGFLYQFITSNSPGVNFTHLESGEHSTGATKSRRRRSIFKCGGGGCDNNKDDGEQPTVMGPFKRMDWDVILAQQPARAIDLLRGVPSGSDQNKKLSHEEGDKVFVDHGAGGCMLAPRNQHRCGSCYAFATIAYFEWLYCKKTLDLVSFSEQFILDCGKGRLRGVSGCDGGALAGVNEFVMSFGLELRSNYVYKRREVECPYANDALLKSVGFMKMRGLERGTSVPMELWPKHLRFGPMLVMMSTEGQVSFKEYGGGVYDGATCHPSQTDHTMLLVGHGREDGQEYWLIRNSYGVSWGEAGYLKLAKKADCIHPQIGFMFGTRDGGRNLEGRPVRNKSYNRAPLLARYADQMANSTSNFKTYEQIIKSRKSQVVVHEDEDGKQQ